jgi:hypothetical protein
MVFRLFSWLGFLSVECDGLPYIYYCVFFRIRECLETENGSLNGLQYYIVFYPAAEPPFLHTIQIEMFLKDSSSRSFPRMSRSRIYF